MKKFNAIGNGRQSLQDVVLVSVAAYNSTYWPLGGIGHRSRAGTVVPSGNFICGSLKTIVSLNNLLSVKKVDASNAQRPVAAKRYAQPMTKDRKIITLLILTCLVTLSSFTFLTITAYFSGKISSSDKVINERIPNLVVQVKTENKVLVKAQVDSTGHYNLNFIPDNQTSFDFYLIGISMEPLMVQSFTTFPSDNVTLNIELPIKYKKIKGKAVCIKCKKIDKVYPIKYCNPLVVKQTIVNGDTIISNIVDNKYNAVTCFDESIAPKWYCDRDKIKY